MTTYLYSHEDFGLHETPEDHPEQQTRYQAVMKELTGPAYEGLVRQAAPEVAWDRIGLAHPEIYQDTVQSVAPKAGELLQLDPDTWMGAHTLSATRRASGAGVAAVDAIMAGKADNAFIVARPPGHHAEQNKAMGFCVFNSAAITALHAQEAHGCKRVAVLDFDVHHGNGTQAIFWGREHCFFGSSHEWPHYPGTGKLTDRGLYEQIFNQPMAAGTQGDEFARVWGDHLLPALNEFDPDFIVISAGFDGHVADPLSNVNLVEEDYEWVTREIMSLARDKCAGRVVSLMEGGYEVNALAKSAGVHVKALASL